MTQGQILQAFLTSWLVLSACLTSELRAAELPPRLDLSATVTIEPSGTPTSIAGTMAFTGLPVGDVCFYLPYNDPDYGNNRGTQQRVDRLTGANSRTSFGGGSQNISAVTGGVLQPVNEYVVRLLQAGSTETVELQYNAKMPLPSGHNGDDWIYDGFYPQLLRECPSEVMHTDYLQYGVSLDIHFKTDYPADHLYLGPGSTVGASASGSLLAQNYVFGLARNMKSMHLEVDDVPIEIHFRESWFLELIPSIEKLVPTYSDLLGSPPFGKFVFVETGELQRTNLPAIISINRPRQSAFNSLLTKGTNWYHWLIARGLAGQWFGTAVTAESPDDDWLIEGLAEFAALEALRRVPERFDLFKPRASGKYFISFDFMAILEISAASLRRAAPFTKLTNSQMKSARPRRLQHPLSYIRHTVALNQIAGQVSRSTFFAFLRSMLRTYRARPLTPKQFVAHFSHLPSPLSPGERQQSATAIQQWWLTEGWPDFALSRYEKQLQENGKWQAVVEVEQKGAVDFAPVVLVTDEDGRQTKVRAKKVKNNWHATVELDSEPDHVEVDPEHEAFDTDRFNNTDRWPTFQFFPGGANTLADDAYTVVWAPYAFRNPGEPFSVAVQAALFRYINGGLFFNGAVAPATKAGLYSLRHRYEYPDVAIHGDFQVEQNYDADRIAEASIVRSPVFDTDPELSVSARVRLKQRMGQPETAHQTIVGGLGLKPAGATDVCDFGLGIEWEGSPPDWHPDFYYERQWGFVSGECRIYSFGLASRLFAGRLTFDGLVPEAALFKPNNLAEARLRLDVTGLARVEELVVSSNDFLFPLIIPLPRDSFVLSRRIKGRLFYDVGRAMHPDIDYRAAGMGFSLPFGGDVSGAGSFAFTRLTVLAVLYTKVGEEISKEPRIVFDFSGQL